MFNSLDISIIRKMQEDLPLVPEPFKLIADELGIKEEQLIEKIKEFCNRGIIRRFGATLNHRNIGFKANAMVVWNVPEDRLTEVSDIMIQFSQVSHCYQRPTFPNWPFNLFTMVHGETKVECEKVISEIINSVNINDFSILYSTKELKKISMRYFIEE
ncbi:MAG: Lrp/AsnC family transcriptional regulator [Clostridiaceae bacterium]|nr:Lrp/AsnC family transcriptional regulator [Clostridiaceae bacterium]